MQTDRYPISALEVEGLPVWFTLGDQEVMGFVKFTRSGRPVYRVGTARKSDDLPKFARPALWRPVNVETWPEALPEPATVQKPVAWVETKPKQESLPDPAVRDVDRWPYPHIVLGRAGEKPRCIEEAEARVLRALRTVDAIYRDRPDVSPSAWPRDLIVSAAVVKKMLSSSRSGKLAWFRDEDYRDVFVDVSDLSPRPARWMPTRRDLSDLDVGCLDWMRDLSRRMQSLMRWRAAIPRYSFTQIAEMTGRDEEDVRKEYCIACARLFRKAGGG